MYPENGCVTHADPLGGATRVSRANLLSTMASSAATPYLDLSATRLHRLFAIGVIQRAEAHVASLPPTTLDKAGELVFELSPLGSAENIVEGVEERNGWKLALGAATILPWGKVANLAKAGESVKVGTSALKGTRESRTVFRALNAADKAALDAGDDILAKGVGGTPAIHVRGQQSTQFISAAERLEAAYRFETPGLGIVEIDVEIAKKYGASIIEQQDILASIRRLLRGADRARAIRDTQRAEEVLFKEFIPFEAIIKRW